MVSPDLPPEPPSEPKRRSKLKAVFVDAAGRVRSGWVLLAYCFILALVHAPLSLATHFFIRGAGGPPTIDDWRNIGSTGPLLISNLVASFACWKLFREPMTFSKRPGPPGQVEPVETASSRPRTFWAGFALGASCLVVTVVGSSLAGHGALSSGFGRWSVDEIALSGLIQLIVIGAGSVGEELFFRGSPFHALSRGTHPIAAMLLTAVVFGVGHINNPNASWVAAANVALVGVLFGLIAWRVSLWASIGLHVAWNWFEGFVFGQPVSGLQPGPGLTHAVWPIEAGFWSGGNFGPEASGLTTVVLIIAIIFSVVLSRASTRNHSNS